MNNSDLFQARWNISRLLLCNLLALALMCFWLWPTGHAVFTQFDEWLFHLLNHPLAESTVWLYIWTVASMRPFDIIVGLILLTLLIKGDWVFEAIHVRQAFFGFLAILILLLIIRTIFEKSVKHMGWQHSSPSVVLPGALSMSAFFPNLPEALDLKDSSNQSFPGDHASVLLIWALFITLFSRTNGQRLVIWGLAFLFMMPRLVAGAHWGQDDYVGGVAMAALALGWGYYTPLAAHASRFLLRVTESLFKPLSFLPVIKHMSVVRFPTVRGR
ncbi:phosphatase PAP2 family protein [Pseudomonas sp. CCI1.2]|uniref:phosphatase PAP2 family protein n=1 Tax=unclassified Pseudomonas TaxID=196821 RepID=UPI002AC9DBE4|nr:MULTISPECIES: phosphatase PAP2 family protein [unclassified Pseudomonas]MEB0092822.1 phosphatase PAP2 family protein [Pseudomonas sp. CCI4.2]MEB0120576.1 phosphatase PAP2 family protein [Pseudomonas sp. CCI1.2]WPX55412.1 phosphatase PAP2 family protein [Pseudomonas sp. CCI4.2]